MKITDAKNANECNNGNRKRLRRYKINTSKNIELARFVEFGSPITWNKEKKRAIIVFYPVFFSVLLFLLDLRYPGSTVDPKDIHGIYP